MTQSTKYTARFSDGQVITRNSKNAYTHAWRYIATKPGRKEKKVQTGFSVSEAQARTNAFHESGWTRSVRNGGWSGWTAVIEVVELERQ